MDRQEYVFSSCYCSVHGRKHAMCACLIPQKARCCLVFCREDLSQRGSDKLVHVPGSILRWGFVNFLHVPTECSHCHPTPQSPKWLPDFAASWEVLGAQRQAWFSISPVSHGPSSSGITKAAIVFTSEGEDIKTQTSDCGPRKKVSSSSVNGRQHDDLEEMNMGQVRTAYPGAEPYASF